MVSAIYLLDEAIPGTPQRQNGSAGGNLDLFTVSLLLLRTFSAPKSRLRKRWKLVAKTPLKGRAPQLKRVPRNLRVVRLSPGAGDEDPGLRALAADANRHSVKVSEDRRGNGHAKPSAPIFARSTLVFSLLSAAAASGKPSGTGCDQACEASPGDRPGGALGMTAAIAITAAAAIFVVAVGVSVSVTAAAVTAIAVVVGEGGDREGEAGDRDKRHYLFCHSDALRQPQDEATGIYP